MSSVKCPECNLTNWSTAISCKRCGYMFQPMGDQPSAEHAVSVSTFEEYQPQSISEFPVPANQTQQSWGNGGYHYQNPQNFNSRSNYSGLKEKSGLATASMVLGISGFLLGCVGGFILAPIGLILGIVSLVKANKYPGEYGGKNFAITGIILSGLLLFAFPVIAAIAIPNLLAARRAANEGSAIASLRTISAAQDTYRAGIGTKNCADFPQLAKNNLIDPLLANGTKSGYRFVIMAMPDGCEIYATPTVSKGVSATGLRSFYSSSEEGWIIRGGNKGGSLADKSDMPLDNGSIPKQTNQAPKIAVQKSPGY